jgi:uncharacterized RDD family membrane protein YckC
MTNAQAASVYDEPGNRLVTGEAVSLDLRPASFLLRAGGAAIDFLVYFGSYVLALVGLTALAPDLFVDSAVTAIVGVVLFVLLLVVAPIAVELLSSGRSLGRLAVGVRIVRDDGGAIGFRHAFIRSLTALLEVYGSFGGIAIIVGLLNERSKRLGDMLAGTYSQNERVSRAPVAVFGVPAALTEWASTADVARMPDRLTRRIAQFLAQAHGLNPASRAALARELAAEASLFVSPVPAADPELFVAAVAVLRRERELAALRGEAARLEALAPALRTNPHGFPDRA